MAKRPNSAPTAAAPTTPPTKPTMTLCVHCVATTEVIAAVSIIPSMPRLIMPARSTTNSPSTASSSGVDATMASRMTSIPGTHPPEGDEGEDHHRLSERGDGRGDVRGALQLSGAGGQRAEENRRGQRGQRMQLSEERHGDAGVAVAGGESLEQPMRDPEQLDAAGQSGNGAGDGHGPDELRVDVDAGVP